MAPLISPITETFDRLGARNELALVAYITMGDPDMETSARLIKALYRAGADIVELGLPFSDPVADGPVLQEASIRALGHGYRMDDYFEMIGGLGELPGPRVIMTYSNPVFKYGLERFLKKSKSAGVSGFILSDVPPEESGGYLSAARRLGLDTIFLAAPTSTPERLELIADAASGFVYCVSRTGTTGERSDLDPGLAPFLKRLGRLTDKPLAVGFGISTPEQVAALRGLAQGAVVGSAIVRVLKRNLGKTDPVKPVAEFVRRLKSGCRA